MSISVSGPVTGGPVTIETLAEEDVQKTTQREALGFLEQAREEALRKRRRELEGTEPPATDWDQPDRGYARGFFSTVWLAASSPAKFFTDLSPRPLGPALTFFALAVIPGALVQSFAAATLLPNQALPAASTLALGSLATIPLALLYLVSVYHAGATLLCRRRLLATTVARATAYGFAPMVLAIVPGVGLVVGTVWSLLLHYHALRRHLGLSRWRAMAVLSMPILPLLAASGVDRLFV